VGAYSASYTIRWYDISYHRIVSMRIGLLCVVIVYVWVWLLSFSSMFLHAEPICIGGELTAWGSFGTKLYIKDCLSYMPHVGWWTGDTYVTYIAYTIYVTCGMYTSDLQTSIYGHNTPLAARQVLANMAVSHWLEEQQPCGRLGMDPVPPTVVRTCLPAWLLTAPQLFEQPSLAEVAHACLATRASQPHTHNEMAA